MEKPGYYGRFGGAFIPETLSATLEQLKFAFEEVKQNPGFWTAYQALLSTYSCRPTPLTYAENLSRHFGGPQIYLKREDLNHTGAHKLNNVIGQGLLVERLGRANMEWLLRPWLPSSATHVPSTWERWMWHVKGPMFFGWSNWAPQ